MHFHFLIIALVNGLEFHRRNGHGQNACSRCSRACAGERRDQLCFRCTGRSDQSVLFGDEGARLDPPYTGTSCRRRFAYGRGLHPCKAWQYRPVHRHLRPGRNGYDYRSPIRSRSSASPVRRRAHVSTRKTFRPSISPRSQLPSPNGRSRSWNRLWCLMSSRRRSTS